MVSVLLLSWNHEKYIEQSIRSVMEQEYRDIEIIFVDNNSTDNTFSIGENLLKSSGLKFTTFKRQSNFSIAQNLNFSFDKCFGEFICILSGDDWLHPGNIIEKLKPFHKNENIAMVYSNGFIYYDDYDLYEPIQISKPSHEIFLQELLKKNIISVQGCIIRREAIIKCGGWDENLLLEDWDMWIRLSIKYDIEKIEDYLFFYRKHAGAISSNADFMYKAREQVCDKYKELNKDLKQAELNNWKTYVGDKVKGPVSLKITWQILKRYKPNRWYGKLLLKSLIPFSIKNKYFIRTIKRRNAKNEQKNDSHGH